MTRQVWLTEKGTPIFNKSFISYTHDVELTANPTTRPYRLAIGTELFLMVIVKGVGLSTEVDIFHSERQRSIFCLKVIDTTKRIPFFYNFNQYTSLCFTNIKIE